jgi:hypothetical protein
MPSTGEEATTNSVEKEQFAGRPVFISTNEKLGSSGSSSANTTPESSAFDPSLHNGTLHNGSLTTSHTRNTNSHSSQLPPPVSMAGAMENGKNHHARQQSLTNSARRRRPRRIYLNKFRVPIYVQLCLVICILCGLCVLVVAVSTVYPALLSPSPLFRDRCGVLIRSLVRKRPVNTPAITGK